MESVVLDGVTYVKASVVAKQFKYTSDYIGQLCRAKKIDARLVGRTWFVNPDTLVDHKKNKHQKVVEVTDNVTAAVSDLTNKIKIHRKDVEAPLKNKTVKATQSHEVGVPVRAKKQQTKKLKVSYSGDETYLFPNLVKKSPDAPSTPLKFLHIEPASAKKLKISGQRKKQTSFETSSLPDVALSGKLDVSVYADIEPAEPEEVQAEPVISDEVQPEPQETTPAQKIEEKPKLQNTAKSAQTPVSTLRPVETKNFGKTDTLTIPPQKAAKILPMPTWVRISPLLATILATIAVFLLLSSSSEVLVTDSISTAKTTLQIATFLEFIAL